VIETTHSARALRFSVGFVVVLGSLGPILAGLWHTARAGFGVIPALNMTDPSLAPLRALLSEPGLGTAIRLTLWTGIAATAISLALAFIATIHLSARRPNRLLTPFLAVPHAALAVGLAFVIAPSGWIGRIVAPLFGLQSPPDLALVNDPHGFALILGLVLKELPFLVLVMLAALTQIQTRPQIAAARSLGYPRATIWVKIIAPQLWPLIRLPVLVVLTYALSTVDMALILGPATPPTLAVLVTKLFSDPDLARLAPASAGALVQTALIVLSAAAISLGVQLLRATGVIWLRNGARRMRVAPLLPVANMVTVVLFVIATLAVISLLAWSFAWRWPWPDALPSWSLKTWGNSAGWVQALQTTLILAVASTAIALVLAIAWLEVERPHTNPTNALIYLPLLIPQIGFLYGLNTAFLHLNLSGGYLAVIWGHALFVFPYLMIALAGPWRAFDPRLIRAAASLGAGRWRRLIRIKLPVLIAPTLTAAAIGIAVSVAQYLPTLFLGAGRISTLTTEAVTLASGSDRRITGVYASLQAAVPLLAYLLALTLPAVLTRLKRKRP
jgi:putative thiamine transport system permease protein